MYYLCVVNSLARKFVVLENLLSSDNRGKLPYKPSSSHAFAIELLQEGLGQFEVHKIEEKYFSYYIATPLHLSPFSTFVI